MSLAPERKLETVPKRLETASLGYRICPWCKGHRLAYFKWDIWACPECDGRGEITLEAWERLKAEKRKKP